MKIVVRPCGGEVTTSLKTNKSGRTLRMMNSSSPSSPPSLDLPSSFDDTLDLSEIISAEGSGDGGNSAKGTRALAAAAAAAA
eukprot:CAMPEP_0185820604 /NCGR_PEP_ID=MMETSP1322-20130828/23961_1 /TAXON_ID=265543 /ORGANISM="Minutocellus polymorphus, Strain RCC2270" /LENGTH=81 /DNA_ID=CAMNT_0028517921 /DNA_START=130 /DNA_END=372 /DNA_ORIENTATION=+